LDVDKYLKNIETPIPRPARPSYSFTLVHVCECGGIKEKRTWNVTQY
jgi:hypothetical protein